MLAQIIERARRLGPAAAKKKRATPRAARKGASKAASKSTKAAGARASRPRARRTAKA
jgi:hypothetical protein